MVKRDYRKITSGAHMFLTQEMRCAMVSWCVMHIIKAWNQPRNPGEDPSKMPTAADVHALYTQSINELFGD
jgi:hypothetical protein